MRKTCAGYAALALIAVAELSVHGQPKPGVEPENATQQLVILDTDIGDDIDDAFALALLLQSPEIKLLGINHCIWRHGIEARLVERYLAGGGPQWDSRGSRRGHAGCESFHTGGVCQASARAAA